MRAPHAIAARWNALWFSPASPYPLAAFRILLGLYLVVYFGTMAPHVEMLFSSHAVHAPYLVPDYAPSPVLAMLLFALLWLCSLALMLGYRVAWVMPALLVLYGHHYFLALAVKHSAFERLIVIYLLALWVGHSDAVWAVSAVKAPGSTAAISCFSPRLLRFQTIALYLSAGLWKAANASWQSGLLLAATLQGVWATPLAFWLVRQGVSPEAWVTLSRAVISGELTLAVLLFFERTRYAGIVLGVLFHVANCVILAIPEFLVCITPYVLFVPEAQFARLAARIEQVVLRRRSRASA